MKLQTTFIAIALFLISLVGGYYYWSLERTLTKQEDIYDNETAKFPSVYKNEKRGIQLTYPSGWQLIPAEQSGETIATFIPESDLSNDGKNEVTVSAKNLNNSPSLDEYTTLTIYAIIQDLLQVKIIDSQGISLQNEPAHQVIYTAQENGSKMKYLQVWLLKNDRSYTITYKAKENSYDDFSPIVQETIIGSFKIF